MQQTYRVSSQNNYGATMESDHATYEEAAKAASELFMRSIEQTEDLQRTYRISIEVLS